MKVFLSVACVLLAHGVCGRPQEDAPAGAPAPAPGAGPQGAPPVYFLKPEGVTDKEGCKTSFDEGKIEVSRPPIFVTDANKEICIQFTLPTKGPQWFLHQSSDGGRCADHCCEFIPPKGNNGQEWEKPGPADWEWYFITPEEECSKPAGDVAPKIATGKLHDTKTVCIKDLKAGETEFKKETATLTICSGPCCIWFTESEVKASQEAAKKQQS